MDTERHESFFVLLCVPRPFEGRVAMDIIVYFAKLPM
jgi:hypothetical protein